MTGPGNRHEQRRRSTHEALRQAALKSFARKGFANVTVTELAREA
ncbi:TetR family transcriptional regulator, partial [Mycobacterium avium subsp. hominissuis]